MEKVFNFQKFQKFQKLIAFNTSFNWHFNDIDFIVNQNIYYRNVHLFVEKIKNLAMIKNSVLIKNNINIVLKNSIQNWYTAELINLKRIDLRSNINEINARCIVLITKFKNFSGVVLIKFIAKKYIVKNAKNRRKFFVYVQIIIRHVRIVSIKKI